MGQNTVILIQTLSYWNECIFDIRTEHNQNYFIFIRAYTYLKWPQFILNTIAIILLENVNILENNSINSKLHHYSLQLYSQEITF